FTAAEADQAFWPDLLSELTGALASDAVWITDLEPLGDFNPLAEETKPPTANAQAANGRSVVKSDFYSGTYGSGSLVELRIEPTDAAKGSKPQVAAAVVSSANAVRIHGYWRENPDSQNVVSKLLKRLRDKPGSFSFSASGADGKPVQLKDEQILKITLKPASSDKGELAFPFEITLPLARKVSIK
ncbi:MAG: hypothetical protein WCP45_04500, partial [Verrucomicrobiota bacterium]